MGVGEGAGVLGRGRGRGLRAGEGKVGGLVCRRCCWAEPEPQASGHWRTHPCTQIAEPQRRMRHCASALPLAAAARAALVVRRCTPRRPPESWAACRPVPVARAQAASSPPACSPTAPCLRRSVTDLQCHENRRLPYTFAPVLPLPGPVLPPALSLSWCGTARLSQKPPFSPLIRLMAAAL